MSLAIPFGRPDIDERDIEAVGRVLRSGWLSTGSECEALESDLAERLGAPHVVSLASCTAALEISLRSLRLRPGARVGVPTWTFVATASAVFSVGAIPVLLDVEEDTLDLSPRSLAAALDEGLEALIVVHFAGVPVDPEIYRLAAGAGCRVIEDAAHALGATDARGPISGVGTVSACFSFYATKNITSGEGGALATHDEELARFARSQRLHGLSADAWRRYGPGADPGYDLEEAGLKANLSDILAALARSQLGRFEAIQQRRRALVDRYRSGLASVSGCRIIPASPHPGSADHLMVVLLPVGVDRAGVMATLTAQGIGSSIHFRPLHRFAWYRDHAIVGAGGTPVADALAPRALSLPLHTGLSDADVDGVVAALSGALA
jgi:dTDP-4-amino-4,6-dideoxygalactose transaminase